MKPRVVFICLGNSCRSIMAEAITNHYHGFEVDAVSAGLRPLGRVAPETLTVLAELGVPSAGLRSKGLNEIPLGDCRALINLTAREITLPQSSDFTGRIYQRPIRDPYGFGLETYRRSRDAIRRLAEEEIGLWVGKE